MASEPQEVQVIQASILQKIGDKTVAEHLEALDPTDVLNPKDTFFYSYKAIIDFRDALIGQPIHILDSLCKNENFYAWIQKAVNFLSSRLLDPSIFNPQLQEGIQPLIDLLYYFNKADATIKYMLVGFEVIQAVPHIKKGKNPKTIQDNFADNYDKSFGIRIQDGVFNHTGEKIAKVIEVLFRNYTSLDSKEPISKLEQACYVAWLIACIMQHPDIKKLNIDRRHELKEYLNSLSKRYFSQKPGNQNYYRNNNDNSNDYNLEIAALFKRTEELVTERLNSINKRDYSQLQQCSPTYWGLFNMHTHNDIVDLKALFLELFTTGNSKRVSFFATSSSYYETLLAIETAKDMVLEWHSVLALLSENRGLLNRIEFFATILQLSEVQLVPNLHDLDLDVSASGLYNITP